MFLLGSESESSAGFQPAVSQDCILQGDRTCQTVLVNAIGMQVENLRYSRTGVLRYAFGLTLTIAASEPPEEN
jgi:hypothetical protein